MKDIITLPEYKIEIPNEKLIECMHMINLHKDNRITKRELKDLVLNKNLIQVGKKDTLDKEELESATSKDVLICPLALDGEGCAWTNILE